MPSRSTRPPGSVPAWILLALVAACGDGADSPAPSKPALSGVTAGMNVVVVLIDTLRPDHLELHGYARETAPFLTSLGERSLVFDRAFSTSSWTAPATASLFTGLYADRHGVDFGLWVMEEIKSAGVRRSLRRFSKTAPSLPKVFQEQGYRTFGVSNNPNIRGDLGFGNGFDRFAGHFEDDAQELLANVYAWEDELRSGDPFLLYVHMNDVHQPYEVRAPWYAPDAYEDDELARYHGEIGWVDDQLRQLFEHFGFADRDVVVVVSDHGEEFGEHGGSGHAFKLYGELQRVLMMWHLPVPGFTAGRSDLNASLIDVLPTLADLAGFRPVGSLDGWSLTGVLGGQEPGAVLATRALFAHRKGVHDDKDIHSAILGDWKVIDDDERGVGVFHVDDDPLDQQDLGAADPARRTSLLKVLDSWRDRDAKSLAEDVEIELDPALQRELSELGYVGED